MNCRSAIQACLTAALCILVAACSASLPMKYYRIEVPAPESAAAGPAFGVTLQVGTIDSPPIMRDGRILYQVDAHEMGAYEYHQ